MIVSSQSPSNPGPPIKTVGTPSQFHESDVLEWENTPIEVRFDREHDNLLDVDDVSDAHRARLLEEYLDALSEGCPDPRLMPLKESSKEPAIVGRCGLDNDEARSLLHTPQEAIDAVANGHTGFCLYAGKESHNTENIVLVDHDDLDTFPEDTLRETLTVRSGSGRGIHETFVNDGSVVNATGTDGYDGEIRTRNWQCALPGTVHPSGGIYHTSVRTEVATLSSTDLPDGLRPSSTSSSSPTLSSFDADFGEETTDGYTNEKDHSLEDARELDWKLEALLSKPYPDFVEHTDDSRIDAMLVWRLRYHHFTPSQIRSIWRQYRPREKLERDDYVQGTIQKCASHNDRWTYYDDTTEDVEWIKDVVAFFPTVDVDDGPTPTDCDLVQEDVWDRTTQTIGRALETDVPTLVEAVPSAGKSTGLVKAISETGVQSTIFTARHDLYDDYKERCEEYDLDDYEELPSLHEYCPTINGEYGSEWEQRVQNAYNNGWTGSAIHAHDTQMFGETIPCERGHECQYKQAWDFDSGNYDVMIGNYKHAYNQNVIEDRTAVIDESQSSAFIESFDSNIVSSVVSKYLQSHDGLPFEDRTDLIMNRDDSERYAEAIEWFGKHGVEAMSVLNTDGRSSNGRINANTHALGSLMTYALLEGRDLGNGWEHASLDLHPNSNAVAARNRGATNDSDELFVLRPPDLSSANGVVCLDGTPSPKMWQMVIDADLNHEQVLSDEERAEYLTDVLGYQIVQTTDATNVYSNADNVNAEKDGALFDAIRRETGFRPSLITSMKAAEEYAETGVLSSIDDVDDLDDCEESDKIEWYGNFKGTNDFEDERVGIVSGSQHYGDDHIKMWCAFANESVERASERGGPDLEYSTELGNEVLKNMREHEVFQAIMRFERGNGDGATVFVNTSAIPDWVPTVYEKSIKKVSDGMRQVIAAIDDLEEHEFQTNEITDHPLVSISESQVQRNLNELNELGTVSSERNPGRATHWSPTNEFARSLFDVGEGTESIGPSSVTGSASKCSLS